MIEKPTELDVARGAERLIGNAAGNNEIFLSSGNQRGVFGAEVFPKRIVARRIAWLDHKSVNGGLAVKTADAIRRLSNGGSKRSRIIDAVVIDQKRFHDSINLRGWFLTAIPVSKSKFRWFTGFNGPVDFDPTWGNPGSLGALKRYINQTGGRYGATGHYDHDNQRNYFEFETPTEKRLKRAVGFAAYAVSALGIVWAATRSPIGAVFITLAAMFLAFKASPWALGV